MVGGISNTTIVNHPVSDSPQISLYIKTAEPGVKLHRQPGKKYQGELYRVPN